MILLSSFGLCSPIVAQKAREYINPENMTVLVVPFAGFNNQRTAKRESEEGLIPFGFAPENIYIMDVEKPDQHRNKAFDMIYVPGGNPFKLLMQAEECGIKEWIADLVKNGAIYHGVSSGADFICENLEYLKLVEDCNYAPKSFDGLGLIKEKVLCHIDQRDMSTLQQVKNYDERGVIFLRNDDLYRIE